VPRGYPWSVVVLLVLIAFVASGGVPDAARDEARVEDEPTSLTITYWADEQASSSSFLRWTLRCNPVGGTLRTRKTACRKLARMKPSAFAPVPRDAVCTQIYGGPEKAVVKGTVGDQRIWASFRRRDGCEIDRWQRFSPWLLPSGGASG